MSVLANLTAASTTVAGGFLGASIAKGIGLRVSRDALEKTALKLVVFTWIAFAVVNVASFASLGLPEQTVVEAGIAALAVASVACGFCGGAVLRVSPLAGIVFSLYGVTLIQNALIHYTGGTFPLGVAFSGFTAAVLVSGLIVTLVVARRVRRFLGGRVSNVDVAPVEEQREDSEEGQQEDSEETDLRTLLLEDAEEAAEEAEEKREADEFDAAIDAYDDAIALYREAAEELASDDDRQEDVESTLGELQKSVQETRQLAETQTEITQTLERAQASFLSAIVAHANHETVSGKIRYRRARDGFDTVLNLLAEESNAEEVLKTAEASPDNDAGLDSLPMTLGDLPGIDSDVTAALESLGVEDVDDLIEVSDETRASIRSHEAIDDGVAARLIALSWWVDPETETDWTAEMVERQRERADTGFRACL